MAICVRDVDISEKRLLEIADTAAEWATLNGMCIRPGNGKEKGTATCAPFALFPTIVPAATMKQAKSTMTHFNRLMHRVAMDHDFLTECFSTLIEVDSFIAGLWNVYCKVREAGIKQPLMLGLFRNDFMLDRKEKIEPGQFARADQLQIKQIEFNSISAASCGIVQQLGKQHRFTLDLVGKEYTENELPENTPASNFAAALIRAWELYGNPESVIIMTVNDAEKYAIDQHWMELRIAEQNPRVRVLKKQFCELQKEASLDNQNRLFVDGDEVGVVYMRHGYAADHYPTEMEWNVRLMLEMSTAIKCPCIQHHLITSKKVQQKLAQPGVLERFIKDQDLVEELKATFADQHSLDLNSEGDNAVALALASPDKYVLKPSREGGGNNLYEEEITDFLTKHGQSKERCVYILMQRIFPWQQQNYLYRTGTPLRLSNVITELGVYGVFLGSEQEELENYECGHLMRTKIAGATEGGVLAGYSSLDTPYLY